MKVKLVGTNVELEPLEAHLSGGPQALLSPEPIAAAYARISRSEKTVGELRLEARENVEKARASNRSIVFEMGHASIAEHAVFNFDLEGISRLAIEEIERSRLASYTERSQRYVLMGRDFHVPRAAIEAGLEGEFRAAIGRLFEGYSVMVEGLLNHQLAQWPDGTSPSREERRTLSVVAKEDARYLLPLATTGQLGLTLNARSLEGMSRRLKGSPLPEVRRVGEELVAAALKVAPSLVRYTEPTASDGVMDSPLVGHWPLPLGSASGQVRLLHVTPHAERLVAGAGAALAGAGRLESSEMSWGGRRPGKPSLVDQYYGVADCHTRAPRLLELVDLVFEVSCSAACFGQLKRHRMATILPQPYHLGLGTTTPPTIVAAGLAGQFDRFVREAESALRQLGPALGQEAAYLLTNAHCRTVLVKINLRELYHFSRLRMDAHAQWEIRSLAGKMVALAKAELPRSGAYLGGKDTFQRPGADLD